MTIGALYPGAWTPFTRHRHISALRPNRWAPLWNEVPGESYAHLSYQTDGTTWFARGASLTPADQLYATFAGKVSFSNYTAAYNLLHFGAANRRLMSTATTGNCAVSMTALVDSVFSFNAAGLATVAAGGWYTFHVAMKGDPSATGNVANTAAQVWINGVLVENLIAATIQANGLLDLSVLTDCAFLGSTTGISLSPAGSKIGFLYLTAGASAANYITDPTKFYNGGDVDLGADGSTPSGSQPLLFVGGQQSLASLNAGTNLGSGGPFTRSGSALTAA